MNKRIIRDAILALGAWVMAYFCAYQTYIAPTSEAGMSTLELFWFMSTFMWLITGIAIVICSAVREL